MRSSYDDLDEFKNAIHEEISVRQMAIDLGIYKKSDFQGSVVKCCFHDDATPSLQIEEDFYRCYAGSCGVKGDGISFVETYYNTGFMEAVRKIADLYHVDISGIKMKFDGKSSQLKKEWESYLHAMQSAPVEAQSLQRDFFPQEIGYDARDRYVVLPLTSKTGMILGFTKRRVDELHEQDPVTGKWKDIRPGFPASKWKHSAIKDSLIAQCHNLYNLHMAGNEIRKSKKAVVCEGPKDAIAFVRIDIRYTVGVCGTSNSNNIWDLLLPVEDIYLAMDGDGAGIGTMVKNIIYLTVRHDITHVFALVFPHGKDPYDVLKDMGEEGLRKIYSNPVPALEFAVEHGALEDIAEIYKITPEYNKIAVLRAVCKVKNFSLAEAESWLFSRPELLKSVEGELDEKSKLLAIVRGELDNPSILPDKAKRILKMKYGVIV